MRLTQSYISVMGGINKAVFRLIALFLGAVALILFVQVVLRYVMHAPLTWSEEVAKYLSIWVVFLGMAVAMRRTLLIAVEALVQSVPSRIGHAMRVLSLVLVMILVGYLAYIGIALTASAADQNFASLELPMSIVYAAVPVGSLLTFLNAGVVLIELLEQGGVKT